MGLLDSPITVNVNLALPQMDRAGSELVRMLGRMRGKWKRFLNSRFVQIMGRLAFMSLILAFSAIGVRLVVLSEHFVAPIGAVLRLLAFCEFAIVLVIVLLVTVEILAHYLDLDITAAQLVHAILGRAMYPKILVSPTEAAETRLGLDTLGTAYKSSPVDSIPAFCTAILNDPVLDQEGHVLRRISRGAPCIVCVKSGRLLVICSGVVEDVGLSLGTDVSPNGPIKVVSEMRETQGILWIGLLENHVPIIIRREARTISARNLSQISSPGQVRDGLLVSWNISRCPLEGVPEPMTPLFLSAHETGTILLAFGAATCVVLMECRYNGGAAPEGKFSWKMQCVALSGLTSFWPLSNAKFYCVCKDVLIHAHQKRVLRGETSSTKWETRPFDCIQASSGLKSLPLIRSVVSPSRPMMFTVGEQKSPVDDIRALVKGNQEQSKKYQLLCVVNDVEGEIYCLTGVSYDLAVCLPFNDILETPMPKSLSFLSATTGIGGFAIVIIGVDNSVWLLTLTAGAWSAECLSVALSLPIEVPETPIDTRIRRTEAQEIEESEGDMIEAILSDSAIEITADHQAEWQDISWLSPLEVRDILADAHPQTHPDLLFAPYCAIDSCNAEFHILLVRCDGRLLTLIGHKADWSVKLC